MGNEQIIAKRPNKVIYRDGDTTVKLFDPTYAAADVLNEALNPPAWATPTRPCISRA